MLVFVDLFFSTCRNGWRILSLMLAWLCPLSFAADVGGQLRMQAQVANASDSLIFTGQDKQTLFNALDVNIEAHNFRVAATAWHEKSWYDAPSAVQSFDKTTSASSNLDFGASQSNSNVELSEFFYDFHGEQWLWSFGKKKLDWDVGYGFRPLDMFSPTRALALYHAVSPGSWLISADLFTERGNITLLCNQSQENYQVAQKPVQVGWGCGGRYYLYMDNWELQALAHYDSRVKARVGFSALTLLNEQTELHASVLYQGAYQAGAVNHYDYTRNDFILPVRVTTQFDALQALIGVNYSHSSGINIFAEYWYDGRSPSKQEWRNLFANASIFERKANTAVSMHRAPYIKRAMQQLFSSHNLFRHNLMLHTKYRLHDWQLIATMLANPQDRGLLLTTEIWYSFQQDVEISLGYRQYTGAKLSTYRQLAQQKIIYLQAQWAF